MNANQQQLTAKEQEVIEKVLNFSLNLNATTICLKNIADKVELDLSIPSMEIKEKVDNNLLREKMQEIEKEIQLVEQKIKKMHDTMNSLPLEKRIEIRKSLCSDGPWKRKGPHWTPEDYLGFLINKKAEYKQKIDDGGVFITSLLGSFDESKKKIFLYLDNIQREHGTTSRKGSYTFRTFVIVAFIHEMFHAWNYFACGDQKRGVLEIDEPMVEFATLLFLKEIAKEYSDCKEEESFAEFDSIRDFAIDNVHNKQDACGETASYGFGYYIYSLLGTKEECSVLDMLSEYVRNSGNISETDAVKKVKELLSPFYPLDKEKRTLELFYNIIFQRRIVLSGWSLEVYNYIKRIRKDVFSLNDIYSFSDEIQQKYPQNNNIRAKIRQQLQILCDKGIIQRIGRGEYSK